MSKQNTTGKDVEWAAGPCGQKEGHVERLGFGRTLGGLGLSPEEKDQLQRIGIEPATRVTKRFQRPMPTLFSRFFAAPKS